MAAGGILRDDSPRGRANRRLALLLAALPIAIYLAMFIING